VETSKSNLLTPLAGAIAAALYPGSSAVAQEAQEASELALEEVIVTATKREVSIQDIPANTQITYDYTVDFWQTRSPVPNVTEAEVVSS